MRFKKIMRRTILYSISLISLWVLLAQCFVMRNRWNDNKAYRVFRAKQVPLAIYDTVINHRHLHYAVCGNGDSLPTLVFIHGSPGSWMNYMKFMWDSSMRKKYRIVAIDRPGFGYSDFGKAMHLQEQGAIILPVLQKLKTKQPMILVGHSMGGPVLVKLAADDPGLFEKIVIVAGSIDVNQEKTETWRRIMATRPLYWCLPGAFGPSNTEILYLKKDLLPLQNDFKNITCKVLFVHGDKDIWVPIGNIAYGKKMMIHAASIASDTLFGAGHNIPWERPDEFKKILLGL
ncbi:MAG: alpha/beta hydrolase [Ferruginibacter sp.]|nr:alpha/beta hydrolase [Ferruginibacter sp.]